MYPQPVLYADFDGYAIKPHPDTRRKVLTIMIYMPEDESQRELGTTVYKISPMGVFAWKTYGLVKEKTAAVPAQHRLRLRRHPPGAQPPAHELARPRDDLARQRETPHDAPQHLLRQAAEGRRGRERVSVRAAALPHESSTPRVELRGRPAGPARPARFPSPTFYRGPPELRLAFDVILSALTAAHPRLKRRG